MLKGVDQLLPAGVVPAVQLVQRLVHHGGGVGVAAVKHLARRALDQALGVVCKALHHPLRCHAAGLGAQLDQGIVRPGALAHAAVRLVVGARVVPQGRLAGLLAQLGRFRFPVAFRFALALGVGQLQRRAARVAQGQHLLHPAAQGAALAGHLQRLGKAGTFSVHAQPVQAGRRRGIDLRPNARRHVVHYGLHRLGAHPVVLRQLLRRLHLLAPRPAVRLQRRRVGP